MLLQLRGGGWLRQQIAASPLAAPGAAAPPCSTLLLRSSTAHSGSIHAAAAVALPGACCHHHHRQQQLDITASNTWCRPRRQQQRSSFGSSSVVAAAAVAAPGSEASEAAAAAAALQAEQQQQPARGEWAVLNFYHLVDVADPDEMLARHKAFIAAQGLDSICGRIYISSQGINCQGGGTREHAERYVDWVAAQPEFKGLFHTLWPAGGPMFPRLRLKLKPNLISLAGGMAGIPVTQPHARATPLAPAEWRAKMAQAAAVNAAVEAGRQDKSKRIVVMDLRNDYEWDAGHFDWAPRPAEEVFAETPVPALPPSTASPPPPRSSPPAAAEAAAAAAAAAAEAESEDEDDDDDGDHVPEGGGAGDVPSPLQGADPDNTEVLMYCTGGIRCDVYSALLRQKGFKNLYTLHGGVQHYLREEGGDHWRGSLFVFDGRMAINPALQADGAEDVPLPAAVPCQLCGAEASLPHINCANMDCNELFIACGTCKTKYQGCCCDACQAAPRLLRPIKLGGSNYGRWGEYAQDPEALAPLISTARSREGRVARRARRRAALKAKREPVLEERRQMRAAIKAAVRAAEAAAAAGETSEGGAALAAARREAQRGDRQLQHQ